MGVEAWMRAKPSYEVLRQQLQSGKKLIFYHGSAILQNLKLGCTKASAHVTALVRHYHNIFGVI